MSVSTMPGPGDLWPFTPDDLHPEGPRCTECDTELDPDAQHEPCPECGHRATYYEPDYESMAAGDDWGTP